jgi:hypothetical protein
MTPQEAYEKRYSNAWTDAAPKVQELWLAAWTIAWAMAEHDEREACAKLVQANAEGCNTYIVSRFLESNAAAIRARGQE